MSRYQRDRLELTAQERGFSLVEVMVAVVVIGILFMVALPAFRTWIQNSQVRNAAEAIHNGLQLARAEALKRNLPIELQLDADSGWTIRCSNPATCANIQTRPGGEGSTNVALTITRQDASTGAPSFVTFDGIGRITVNTDGSAAIQTVDVDSSTLAAADSRELRVQVSAAGQSRLCDPAASLPASDPRKCF